MQIIVFSVFFPDGACILLENFWPPPCSFNWVMKPLHHKLSLPMALWFLLFSLCTPHFGNAETASGGGETRDRRDSSNAASAMALAAAAMAQVMCMEMMRQAQETGDRELMMMAMQMCAQAAQNAANAAQNKEGSKKMTTGPQMPNANSFPVKDAKMDTQSKPDSMDLSGIAMNGQAKSSEIKLADSPKVNFQSGSTSNEGEPNLASNTTSESNEIKEPTALPIAEPSSAESSAVTLGQGNAAAAPNGAMGLMNASAPSNSSNDTKLSSSTKSASETSDDLAKKSLKKLSGSKGSEGGGGSTEAAGGAAFDDLMGRMGGGFGAQGNIASAGLTGGLMDLAQGLKQGPQALNIFEFATIQYQKAKTSGLGQPNRNQSYNRNILSAGD